MEVLHGPTCKDGLSKMKRSGDADLQRWWRLARLDQREHARPMKNSELGKG